MKIYNTLTRKKENFIPIENWKVRIYSCWPTVYSMPHLWNIRAAFVSWLFSDCFKFLWYHVTSVMNLTDVWHLVWDGDCGEDKVQKIANDFKCTAYDVANKYINIFKQTLNDMEISKFTHMPRATEYIEEQIDIILKLEKLWYTYVVEWDGIYMDTSKVETYWKLIWKNYKKHIKWLNAWERVKLKWKKNLTDFALWKFHMWEWKRDMERDSPRWLWFPWRHTECCAMSASLLWLPFDIHHWWYDLIPIHHTNEIAQYEALEWKKCVNYRTHNQFVLMNWKKMSKSDWNYVSIQDILDKWYTYNDIRYLFLSKSYRWFIDFTWDNIELAKKSRLSLCKKIYSSPLFNWDINNIKTDEWIEFMRQVQKSIEDDFNTPKLISIINKNTNTNNEEIIYIIQYIEENILKIKDKPIVADDNIRLLFIKRIEAKSSWLYTLADTLRKELEDKWFTIEDSRSWYKLYKEWCLLLTI